MGKYSLGVNGAVSGKVGSVIGSNWRNVDYLRGLSKRKKKGSSLLQIAQQMKFALCANQLRVIKDVLNIGFSDKKLNNITGYNAAVRHFLSEAITGEYPDFEVNYSKIRMSKGSVLPLFNVSVSFETEISITWEIEANGMNCFADDKLVLIVYNKNRNAYRLFDTYERGELVISIPFGGTLGDEIHMWAFCIGRGGLSVSDSSYVGTLIVPAV